LSKELERILERLDQVLPPPPPATDWKGGEPVGPATLPHATPVARAALQAHAAP